MWEIASAEQIYTFLWATVLGAAFCMLYDLFRARRRTGEENAALMSAEDILFSIFAAVITFLFLLVFCCGQIRAFVLLGEALGFILCRLTVSRIWLKLSESVFRVLRRFFSFVGSGMRRFEAFFNSSTEKILLFFKKRLKKPRKIEKNS